ncbi:pyrimidine-nucleoside phosphorylase [Caldisericum exile]|uniref:thymidine phosphorylase n=1 Tax=Caldisericum exile (strain DSM 21853 / NBRC 104410 / AZM16c01) TaxID=511051 RepID=A0A7U6GEX1_CALEA|nr:pyrimidine-nucleoside phosphorylase [Caldisericum exile]BAL81115.1 putative pyrimidine-nucleoside phosphorylase [Caldisericum exile AZM16c01]
MSIVEIIEKKKYGKHLEDNEIKEIVMGYVEGIVPDYQVAAFLMAVWFRGMDDKELSTLTDIMIHSGKTIDLSKIHGIKVDKHSSGGVADTVTIPLVPIVASLGVPVAKMSGRGLGHTGGTIDKLESIPGFRVEVPTEEFINIVNRVGGAIISQSEELVPADKKIYALRDVTGTVDSIPLIASSIMSKKIASGTDAIVLDVKVGNGAFMEDLGDALKLAEAMVRIGNSLGRKTVAYITDMNEPLGDAIGNSIEVEEGINILKGKGSKRLFEVIETLGSEMLVLGGRASDRELGKSLIREAIASGKALQKLAEIIEAQGGNKQVINDFNLLPQAKFKKDIISEKTGYISRIDTKGIGRLAQFLGAGREKKDDVIDLSCGIIFPKKLGDYIEKGQQIGTVLSNNEAKLEEALNRFNSLIEVSDTPIEPPPLIYYRVSAEGVDKLF